MKTSNNRLTLMHVKTALSDERFRVSLPEEFDADVTKYLSNPGCACNQPLYRKLLASAREQLASYYPSLEIPEQREEAHKNHWRVINCSAGELEGHLRRLGEGRKQIAIARYEDQITLVVNDLDYH